MALIRALTASMIVNYDMDIRYVDSILESQAFSDSEDDDSVEYSMKIYQ